MSRRLHVAKKYEVQYSTTGFNHCQSGFNRLLDDISVVRYGCGDFEESPSDFSVERLEFENALNEELRPMPKSEIEKYFDYIYTKEDVIEMFESILKEADPRNKYIYISFF